MEKGKKYIEKTVFGCCADIKISSVPIHCSVTVRVNKDWVGKSLSLQAHNIVIEIPLDEVEEIITLAERKGEKE